MAKSIFNEPTLTFSLLNIMKFPKGVAEIMSRGEWARPADNNRPDPPDDDKEGGKDRGVKRTGKR